jgi:hypothetical protein
MGQHGSTELKLGDQAVLLGDRSCENITRTIPDQF